MTKLKEYFEMNQEPEYSYITREDGEIIEYIPFVPLTEDQKKFNQLVEDQAERQNKYREDFDSRRNWFKKHPGVPYPETPKSSQSFQSSLNAISYDSDSDDSDDSDDSYDSADDSNYSDSFDPY